MTLFDRYVVIDWSASARPATGANSIWFAILDAFGSAELSNPATRHEAAHLLAELVADGYRVLIGVDANLGYPRGTAALFELDGAPWRAMWDEVARRSSDDARNRNNRFTVAAALNGRTGAEGPFWGCPAAAAGDLRPTKPASFPVDEFRTVERRLRAGGRYPKSVFQLLGAGAVGGQTLTLLPVLHELLGRVEVWPFTTGWAAPTSGRPVIAEVWPSLFVRTTPVGTVVDAAQVAGTAEALRAADRSGALAGWFGRPADVEDAHRHEEGWILGTV